MPDQLFEDNLSLFHRHGFDWLKPSLPDAGDCRYHLSEDDRPGGPNLNDGHGASLYQEGALIDSARQVAAYMANPTRYHAPPPRHGGASHGLQHDRLIKSLLEEFRDLEINGSPEESAGFLISFGLGLGFHLPLLLDRLPAGNLIIVEPDPELIRHSLTVLDWAPIFQAVERRQGEILFLTGTNPEACAQELMHALRSRDYPLADGSYLIAQRNDNYFEQLIPAFRESLANLPASMGFFEDECLMLRYFRENLSAGPYRQLSRNSAAAKPMPAFIIGSGPSFDAALPALKANREKAVYFSVGTGISSLNQAGIRPDFHCEVENTDLTVEALQKASPGGFPETVLIASSTVPPGTAALFQSVIYCQRDSVVPSRLFLTEDEVVPLAVPTVANLACRSAMAFGLPEIVFFGVDFGSPEPDRHHSDSSVYRTEGSDFFATGAGMDGLTIPVPGNRGETVYTNRSFFNAKVYLDKLVAVSSGYRFYNAGQGLKVEGATPIPPDQFQLPEPPNPPAEVISMILSELPLKSGGDALPADRMHAFEQAAEEWFDTVISLARDTSLDDVQAFYLRLRPYLIQGHGEGTHSVDAAMRALPSGSMMMMVQAAWFLLRRLDEADRPAMRERFRQLLLERLLRMREMTGEAVNSPSG